VTTKCGLGSPEPAQVERALTQSLEASLAAMKIDHADIFFLHSNICADDYVYANRPDLQNSYATRWSIYTEEVVPAMEKLKASGKIRTWGITGSGVPDAILRALRHSSLPSYIQAVTNLLDSAGSLCRYADPARPRELIAAAVERGVGVLGIRAVQAGALTAAVDRELTPNNPDRKDYERAAPFRALCKEIGQDPAVIAHRYALSMPGVATVILGVKNRDELKQCVDAEAAGPLEPALLARIDALGLKA
jgi:aryl-alcohol dehydrogenase-like predicted oxidoreductase